MTTLCAPPPILIGCLTCGWVHGFPWRCPPVQRGQETNGALLPRGAFFDSKLFAALNGSWNANSPLAGANVYANDNNGSAHLNAQVIQMVMIKNATLAQSWAILDLAVRNGASVVTAFALAVAPEFYTLGFAQEVDDLAANTFVESTGNASAPPPSPEWWENAWNSLVGFGQWVWNGIVAVGVFFYKVGKWLVDIGIGIYKGVVEGNWTYLQENVIEPLRKALEVLLKFIVDMVTAIVNLLLDPILRPIREAHQRWSMALVTLFDQLWNDPSANKEIGASKIDLSLFGGDFPSMMFSLIMIVSVIQKVGAVFERIVPVASAIGTLIKTLLTAALKSAVEHWWQTALALTVGAILAMFIPPDNALLSSAAAGGWTMTALLTVFLLHHLGKKKGLSTSFTDGDEIGLYLSVTGLILSLVLTVIGLPTAFGAAIAFFLALFGLVIGLGTSSFTDALGPTIGFLDEAISAAILGYSIVQLVWAFTST